MFKKALEKRFEIKTQCVGPAAVNGGWKKVAGTASGPAGETMRPVIGPKHPPPPGPGRRCPGDGVCPDRLQR